MTLWYARVHIPASPEPLLASCVPELQLGLAGGWNQDSPAVELDTDSGAWHSCPTRTPTQPISEAAQQ